jgi:membrane-associated protein
MIHAGHALGLNVLDPHSLLSTLGAFGVFLVLLAETGLLIGIVLPGDSLLFTAGLLCSTSATDALHLSLGPVLVCASAGAMIGAQVGYVLGRVAGPALLRRPDRPRLRRAMIRAQSAIARYGPGKAIVLGRFIPLVRTVINPLAGAVGMPPRVFLAWQIVGGLLWSVGVSLTGYALGAHIPNIDHYLLPVIAVIVALSLIPVGLELRRERAARHRVEMSR